MRTLLLTLSLAVLIVTLVLRRLRTRSRPPYPPTPPGHFLLGNIEELQSKQPRTTYEGLAKRYGEIFHLTALGEHAIVLNTMEVADELFNARAHVYSDRPSNALANLMGWGDVATTFMPYGHIWRSHRRLLQQGFSALAIRTSCHHIQSEKLNKFLLNLITSPDAFMHHTEMLLGSVIMRYVHGRDIDGNATEDPLFKAAADSARNSTDAMLPGQWLVNAFPVLRFLPEWLPGCGFQTFARETKEMVTEVVERGYEDAVQHPDSAESLIRTLDSKKGDVSGQIVKHVCGTAYAAASETTRTTLGTFFVLMREHPEVQQKAHQEIVRVIGANKLPEFGDRDALPYIQAIYLEVMRWMPAVPLSIPHSTTEDDIFRGYFIPKGTIVVGNTWVILNDEKTYPDPRAFKPERFLTEDGQLKANTGINFILGYGYGRRVCPGRHFADALIWRVMACVMAGFVVGKSKNENADSEHFERLEDMFNEGIIAHAAPFTCSITPRTPEIVELIRGQNL